MSSALELGEVAVGGRVWIAPMTGVSDLPFRRAASALGAAYVDTDIGRRESLYLQPNFSSTKTGGSIAAGRLVLSLTAGF